MIILNQEQEKIAYAKVNGHMAVKGIAGSGKTSCGIARIPFLLQNYCPETLDKVLLLTYNKTLVNYVNYIYNEFSKEKSTLFPLDNSKVEIKSVDKLMHFYYRKYCKRKDIKIMETISEFQSNEIIKEIVSLYHKNYPSLKQINESNLEFIKNEIKWIQSCNYISESEYQVADRSGLSNPDSDGPQKLGKNSEIRKVIFNIFLDYLNKVKLEEKITFEAFKICGLKEVKLNPEFKYKHIIVDEAQDLSKIQLEFIREIYAEKDNSSILFLYDGAQSIYEQAWIGKGKTFKSVGFDMVGRSRTLTKNFRTTTQISQAAMSLIKNQEGITKDEHYVEPKLIDRQGEFPVYKKFEFFHEQVSYIKFLVEEELKAVKKKDITIIARTTDILKELEIGLNSMGVNASIVDKTVVEFNEDKVKLITMHSIKGLESRVIIVASCNEGVVPLYLSDDVDSMKEQEITERKLFYVGMTRASERLYLISHGQESQFIKDLDKNYLLFDKKMKLRAFHNISIDDYLFKSNPKMEMYKPEEKVRQWMLKELIESYGYLREDIDIEFQMKIGSKTYYADIVIYKKSNYSKVPYILIEVKKEGALVPSDKGQLESYCIVNPTVDYSILTDGKTVFVYDKKFCKINDIPEATNYEIEGVAKQYEFIAIKEGYDCNLIIKEEQSNKIEILENGSIRAFNDEDLLKTPVIGKICAGDGFDMDEELLGELPLPKKWSLNSFILKVRGDSMIDADINDGDQVLIKKDIAPLNGDIVVCTISNEEATLKRFQRKSDQIILIPENKDYERIYLNPNDENIRVIGVLSGIIKEI